MVWMDKICYQTVHQCLSNSWEQEREALPEIPVQLLQTRRDPHLLSCFRMTQKVELSILTVCRMFNLLANNHLQMSLQRQHFLFSYLKTLSVGRARDLNLQLFTPWSIALLTEPTNQRLHHTYDVGHIICSQVLKKILDPLKNDPDLIEHRV